MPSSALLPSNTVPLTSAPAGDPPQPTHFLADLYTFQWTELNLRLPLLSASAVALCLFVGIAAGHPSGGLIAGGGAFTVGFGANQRIADSRLIPMLAAIFACASATLAGTIVGHHGYELVLAACGSAFIYGVLTAQNTGLSWVGQQASVALLVASAFPSSPRPALIRAGLILAGGAAQLLFTSVGLRLLPELHKNLIALPRSVYSTLSTTLSETLQIRRANLLHRLQDLPLALPGLTDRDALTYSLRLVLTVGIASELYHRLGIQSGYWIPMTALLVQKPAFFETFTRAAARILGTLAGAWLCTLLLAHVTFTLPILAAAATLSAFLAFATSPTAAPGAPSSAASSPWSSTSTPSAATATTPQPPNATPNLQPSTPNPESHASNPNPRTAVILSEAKNPRICTCTCDPTCSWSRNSKVLA